MKIAVIASGDIPSKWAHSINTIKHAKGFYKLGNTVEIIIISRICETIFKLKIKNIQKFYAISSNIKIKTIYDKSIFFFKEVPFIGKILNQIISYLPKIVYILDPEKCITNYCKKNGIQLSYCRSYRSAYYNIMSGIPSIIESHTIYTKHPELQKLLKLSSNEHFLALVTIHEDLKKRFINEGLSSNKIIVIEDAVDIDEFNKITQSKKKLRKLLGLPIKENIVIYCGSLKEGKGIKKLLETALFFDDNVLFYVIGGNKKYLKYWKKKTKEKDITNLKFIGYIENRYVPRYLKCADILFLPFDLKEKNGVMDINTTSPIKLFEYMASKVPIVSIKIPTIEKIINHNKEALLANSDGAHDYFKLIKLLLDNKELGNSLAQNAYNCVKKHTYENRCRIILENFG